MISGYPIFIGFRGLTGCQRDPRDSGRHSCGDMMFCNLKFGMKYLTLVSSALSIGIIVDTIRPLSTGYNS